MAAPLFTLSLLLILCTLATATPPGLILTVVNNCPFTIWPAIQPNAGHPALERGGFALSTLTHRSFPAPSRHWSGRFWARTGCSYAHGRFSCATGDCGGRLECDGHGGAAPATLAQFSLHHGHADFSSYGVSLVDGFNLPMTVTPHEGKGSAPWSLPGRFACRRVRTRCSERTAAWGGCRCKTAAASDGSALLQTLHSRNCRRQATRSSSARLSATFTYAQKAVLMLMLGHMGLSLFRNKKLILCVRDWTLVKSRLYLFYLG
nr:osmotin-like protein [Sesamum indicum]